MSVPTGGGGGKGWDERRGGGERRGREGTGWERREAKNMKKEGRNGG